MATKFKRNGFWYVKYKDIDGKWKNVACGVKAKSPDAEYIRKEYDARELNYRHKAPVRIMDVALLEALRKFKEEVLPGEEKARSSVKREQAVIDNFVNFLNEYDLLSFKVVTKDEMVQYMNERRNDGRAPKTRREERRVLRKFFKWAIKKSYCISNPAKELDVPKIEKKKPRYFSEEELLQIFNAAKEPYRTIFKFLYLTGLRIGELGNLEWQDFNERGKYITIRIMEGNKTKREETVPLNRDAMKIMKQRKAANEHSTFIFVNAEGNKLDNDNIYRSLKRIMKSLKINNASPHTFRHTCASHMVIKGISIYTVKEILRHKSVKETEVYAHLSNMAVKNAVEVLGIDNLESEEM